MTVRELIEELSQIPDDYEVQVTLSEIPERGATKEEEIEGLQSPVADSAFIYHACAWDEEKTAIIMGCALPEPEDNICRFDLYGSHLTAFQRAQIEAWLGDAYEDGVRHPFSSEDAETALLIAGDKVRYDSDKKLFFKKGSPGYVALEGKRSGNN